MKGKFTTGRLLKRWRIALGCMPWWKFAALVFVATFAVKTIAILLFGITTGIEDEDVDPERARRIGWFIAVVVVPLLETLIAQALVIWLVHKALPKSFWWPVIFSAAVFGGGHQQSPVYLVCMLFVGLVWAFAYQSRFERQGFGQAFWLIFLIHASNNAIAFIL
ncbi:CPBP family glutamic-type intramembrane protease [Alistipes sp. D31t1_170403_E11]|uniref:CPBP family glutamic-type intramembrane protease n=1 Tax=Alistipes sp. D31t1_170403_E11 TaxID=2787128 RepID=UPI00189B6CC8|nr:CPBP family glutamic-type intramembrane protease [Alistipes sp. D31t1_170403_E11]